jgi:hypothetical protein
MAHCVRGNLLWFVHRMAGNQPGALVFTCIPTLIKPRGSELIELDFSERECRYYSALAFDNRLSINTKNSAR